MSEYEPITGELRGKMDTLGWYDEDGNIVFTMGGTPVSEIACLAINSKTFERLCDAIDAVHAGLERENAELRERVAVLDNERGNMHDCGRITDELRGWYKDRMFMGNGWQELDNIADRIDAEHESACADAYGNGVMSVPIALDESAWVELPKDADGEYIHIGDEMEYGKAHGRVIALMLSNYPKKWGGGLHWGIQLEGEHAPTALDSLFRHYHAPTVEDVLREFAYGLGVPVADSYVAATAAKLRLAGDAS